MLNEVGCKMLFHQNRRISEYSFVTISNIRSSTSYNHTVEIPKSLLSKYFIHHIN